MINFVTIKKDVVVAGVNIVTKGTFELGRVFRLDECLPGLVEGMRCCLTISEMKFEAPVQVTSW